MPIAEFGKAGRSDAVLRALSEDGAVILRHALPNDELAHLRLLCTAAFAIMDIKVTELNQGTTRPDDLLRPHVETYRRLQYVADDVLTALLAQATRRAKGRVGKCL